MIVTFVDGSWTDNLSIARYTLRDGHDGLMLTIEVAPREARGMVKIGRKALANLVDKHKSIHTIQISKPRFVSALREPVRLLDMARLGLRLSAKGVGVA